MIQTSRWSVAAQRTLRNANRNIYWWVNSPVALNWFQVLLQKQRQGVQVELAINEQKLALLDITRQYLYNFQQAGGIILRINQQQDEQSYLLIDGDKLLLNYASIRQLDSRIEVVEETDLLDKCIRHFKRLKNSAVLTRLNATDLAAGFSGSSADQLFPHLPIKLQVRFWAVPDEVEIDERFELFWEVTGADQIDINCGIGAVAARGCRVLSARKDAEFTLTATNNWDNVQSLVKVVVNPAPKIRYHITTFDHRLNEEIPLTSLPGFPHRYAIIEGQPIRLYWVVFNAHKTSMEGQGSLPHEGVKELTPERLSSYTIIAEGEQETVRQRIVLNVFSAASLDRFLEQNLGPSTLTELPTGSDPEKLLAVKEPPDWSSSTPLPTSLNPTPTNGNWAKLRGLLKSYLKNGK